METITQSDDLEERIANMVVTTTHLVDAIKSSRRVVSTKAKQKNRLRQAFTELAELKACRSASVIHRLDSEIGLGELA